MNNQNISYFHFERKVMKWWKKFFFCGLDVAINNAYIISNLIESLSKKSNENFKRNLLEELLKEVCIDENKLEKENCIPTKYINMLHNIKIVKCLHKKCVYCRKNGIIKITNAKYNKCDISMCPECHLSYHKICVYKKINY